jgi:hypothetical protein
MRRKPMPNALDIDLRGGLTDAVTPSAGIALLIDAMRRAGVSAAADRHLPAKRSPKGLGQGAMVETFVLLSALGGDCIDDLDHLRRDMGLAALTGYTLPAASTARQWLDRFHEEDLLAGRPAQGAFLPMESAGLAGLRQVLVTAVRTFVTAVPVSDTVTLDVDAHLVESSKATALRSYEGFRGYQPAIVSWAETGLVLADQFRDGNVPAGAGLDDLVDEAYAALPSGREWRVSVRSDSAAYDHDVLDHWAERRWRFPPRPGGSCPSSPTASCASGRSCPTCHPGPMSGRTASPIATSPSGSGRPRAPCSGTASGHVTSRS